MGTHTLPIQICFIATNTIILNECPFVAYSVTDFENVFLGFYYYVKTKTNIRNRNNQVPHLTRDTIWESDKNTKKHYIQESQEVSLSEPARKRQDSIIKTNVKYK